MTQNKYLACAYVLVTGCTLAWASQAMDYVHANDEPVAITVQIQPVNESDSLALVAFYEGSAGERWDQNINWLTGPVASWYGVTVQAGRVTRLELVDNNVLNSSTPPNRTFPRELGDLTALEVLNLERNSLNADIPPELGKLVNLNVLNLASNSLLGEIPPEIGDLVQLKELYLQANLLQGAVPGEIANLVHLETLYLSNNELDALPDLSRLDPLTGTGALSTLVVNDNHLTFEDIEPNYGRSFSFSYVPQRNLPRKDVYRQNADSVSLVFSVGGAANQYQWFKDEESIPGANSERLDFKPLTRPDAGRYVIEIRSPIVTNLVLKSEPITVRFIEEYTSQWLDIGEYHHSYTESGSRHWRSEAPEGMEYPAILRHSGHVIYDMFWIGIKDWTDPSGIYYPYYVARQGPLDPGSLYTYPIQNKLVGRYEDTLIEVNGTASTDNEAVLDEVDPGLPADRMVHTIHNMSIGITVDRKAYAYTNEYHDNYHVIDYAYCNTGNVDNDEEIELPNQTLHDVIFFRVNRWRGNEQAAQVTGWEQPLLGRYTIHDTVGDGYEEYPVDFTAQYAWPGFANNYDVAYSTVGSPLFSDANETVAPGDSIGRLAGATMIGRSVLHADRSASDPSYDRNQPAFMAWVDNDNALHRGLAGPSAVSGPPASHESLYEGVIVDPFKGVGQTSCENCWRAYPHFADLAQGDPFWLNERLTLGGAFFGGFSQTEGYGPYEMGPGECVNVTVADGIDGLSFDAAAKIGQLYKQAGNNRDEAHIEFDADGNGVIDTTPFDYENVFVGTESQTKYQWFLSARDSLFQTFNRAGHLFAASQSMTAYPVAEPPRAPVEFSVWGRPNSIDLDWKPASDGPAIQHWEIYRTEGWEDNLYVNGCLEDASIPCGYERVATLPDEATSFTDTDVEAGIEYFYYLQAVGETQSVDPNAVNGTPGGIPLRSGRYLTQTYKPVSLQTSTALDEYGLPTQFSLQGNYPNPFSGETTIRYVLPEASDVQLSVFDILGREVKTLIQDYQVSGSYSYTFVGSGLANGVYVYVLQAGRYKAEGKMVLVR
ncbi:MAG: T9SS type A sorting domain-containing protein [Rhodothermaceae bacterium]|nr:T9SS type A sorting domain-containing protein [Rhodothermaceae bacterium]